MKPVIITILVLFVYASGLAQADTAIRYFKDHNAASEKDSVWYYQRIGYPAGNEWYAKEYGKANLLLSEGYYTDSALNVQDSVFKFYMGSTYLGSGSYKQGKKIGSWKSLYDDGKKKDTAYYIDGIAVGAARSWYNSGKLKSIAQTDQYGNGTEKGLYENGRIEHEGPYDKGKQQGKWTYYHANGKPSSVEMMTHDSLLSVACFDEEGKPETKPCEIDVESDFPGGERAWLWYLSQKASKFVLPPAYFNKEIYGTVVVQFFVDENGNVIDAKVVQSVHPALDTIALDIIATSREWLPAIQHNRHVKAYKRQPVTFPKYNGN